MLKDTNCGELRREHDGRTVTLAGWVHRRRDHGGLIFIDLRDTTGLVQCVIDPSRGDAYAVADQARAEWVLQIEGQVALRPPETVNPRLVTGEVEVRVARAQVLNDAKIPPFHITDAGEEVEELLRLRYRYLDLRRDSLHDTIRLRHRIVKFMRDFLCERDFIEVETPILIKSTPEGARDYIVPSRLQPGYFYALPQSPQILKQLLMVAGFERYFQIARCFRDEDTRADRQPEFSQLDIEMSFVRREDVMALVEDLYTAIARECAPGKRLLASPFPRLTYQEAMERYGSDRPDLRFGLELRDVTDVVAQSEFGVFRSAVAAGGRVKALVAPGCAGYSRSQVDELTRVAQSGGAKGLATLAVSAEGVRSPVAKFLSDAEVRGIVEHSQAKHGDLVLLVADRPEVVAKALGGLRVWLGERLDLADSQVLAFCWIYEFPLLEWREEERRWDATHNPFSGFYAEDEPLLESDPGKVRALQYDLVCNGSELGGGSIRNHRREMQERLFGLMGYSPDDARQRFGALLDALEHGAPPHGGIATGIERLLMVLRGTDNIRDVVAFPKTQSGGDPMLGSPAPVDERQLRDLHLRVVE